MTREIPTVEGLPYFGSAFKMLRNPVGTIEAFTAEYADIVQFTMFGSPGLLIVSPELVREVLVTKGRKFRKADLEVALMSRFLGNGLVTNNKPASHKRQRKLAQPAFHHKRIAGYADTIVEYTQLMLDEWRVGEVLDVAEEMAELTMYIVCKTLFDADRDDMSGSAKEIGDAISFFQEYTQGDFGLPFFLPEWIPTRRNRLYKSSRETLNGPLADIIAARRTSGEDKQDLLSMLLMAQDEDGTGMSDQQLLDEVVTLFAAGHETTSNALMWTFYLLSQHPDIADKLVAEVQTVLGNRSATLEDLRAMPYSMQVLKESMRLYPPAYALNGRLANEDVEIGGYLIPKNTYIIVSPWGLHHNARIWDEPSQFDPERFNADNEPTIPRYAYIPFGAGSRVCIGSSFAMMEAQLILVTVLQRFGLEMLASQTIEFNQQITLSNKTGMHMRVLPQQKAEAVVSAEVEAMLAH